MIPKYRAWTKSLKWMCDVTNISFDSKFVDICQQGDTERCIEMSVEFDEIKLMQSTGLTDKNGKEIFDGDIVRTTRFLGRADEIGGFYEYEKDYVGVVKVLEGSWVIDTGIVAVRLWSEIDESEVLGNIYENPELLEEANETL